MEIFFSNVSKLYANKTVLKNINLHIPEGKIMVFTGPAGSGKSTCLKLINKLISPTAGNIYIGDDDISKLDEYELRKRIGYVIQNIGLMPHMTVASNIGLIPRLLQWDKKEIDKIIRRMLEVINLDYSEYGKCYPHQLSLGDMQRVAMARALAANPGVLLLDEPFTAIDAITRNDLQEDLLNIHKQLGITTVLVTHDIDEALKLSDYMCIFHNGEILQQDTPEQILKNPACEEVESFIAKYRFYSGSGNIPHIKEVLVKPVFGKPEMTPVEALNQMRRFNVDSLIVVDNGIYQGVARIWDIQKNFNNQIHISEILQRKYPTVKYSDSLLDAVNIIKERNLAIIPVLDDDKTVKGVITRASLADIITDYWPAEDSYA